MHSRSPLTLLLALGVLTLSALPQPAFAQEGIAEPFKVGTFEIDGTQQVALVLRDRLVVAIQPANRDLTAMWTRRGRRRPGPRPGGSGRRTGGCPTSS